ncbi:FAD-dependent oxidoreductase [uncultured Kiloniella sp.]|uniref:NAD(P)/FAD-dependent oxidoreductase n=1 Tax=uncultured Kiloniella sp. TaxID=1133091 RepID=UPI002607FDC8|nr:FAD-dependent oxidoreductase [uncultured Kiloniella sp.]
MKIAIIGSGISGLGAAYLLHPHHDITVYEKGNYLGGHSRTIDISPKGTRTPVDTGFIVFNHRNYYHLTRMFKHLNVPTIKSDMSFGASIHNGWLEYGSKGMFAQKRNLLRPRYWKMIWDILSFNKKALPYLENNKDASLEQCLNDLNLGDWFKRYYLQAMGAAIWSCSVDTILKFPARTFIRFFDNHGLLSVNQHPQWYTVKGGSREYVQRISASFQDHIKLNCGVVSVKRKNGKVEVLDDKGNTETYDQIVFACHADQALKMLDTPTQAEERILGNFTYQKNTVVVHGDTSFMPRKKGSWASWVYLSEQQDDQNESVSLSYWMNNLQDIDHDSPVIITLNPGRQPAGHLIYDMNEFEHPIFTKEAVDAQEQINTIQGQNNLWFCGAYQQYGFHEDGLASAVRVAQRIGVSIPWE